MGPNGPGTGTTHSSNQQGSQPFRHGGMLVMLIACVPNCLFDMSLFCLQLQIDEVMLDMLTGRSITVDELWEVYGEVRALIRDTKER